MERFPDEEIDEDIMIVLLEVFAKACSGSKTLTKYLTDAGSLSKIAVQLSIVLEELNGGTQ